MTSCPVYPFNFFSLKFELSIHNFTHRLAPTLLAPTFTFDFHFIQCNFHDTSPNSGVVLLLASCRPIKSFHLAALLLFPNVATELSTLFCKRFLITEFARSVHTLNGEFPSKAVVLSLVFLSLWPSFHLKVN